MMGRTNYLPLETKKVKLCGTVQGCYRQVGSLPISLYSYTYKLCCIRVHPTKSTQDSAIGARCYYEGILLVEGQGGDVGEGMSKDSGTVSEIKIERVASGPKSGRMLRLNSQAVMSISSCG